MLRCIYDHILFIQAPVKGPLGCVQVSAVVNNAAANMGMKTSLETLKLFSRMWMFLGCIPRSGTDAPRDGSL